MPLYCCGAGSQSLNLTVHLKEITLHSYDPALCDSLADFFLFFWGGG